VADDVAFLDRPHDFWLLWTAGPPGFALFWGLLVAQGPKARDSFFLPEHFLPPCPNRAVFCMRKSGAIRAPVAGSPPPPPPQGEPPAWGPHDLRAGGTPKGAVPGISAPRLGQGGNSRGQCYEGWGNRGGNTQPGGRTQGFRGRGHGPNGPPFMATSFPLALGKLVGFGFSRGTHPGGPGPERTPEKWAQMEVLGELLGWPGTESGRVVLGPF